MRNTVVTVFRVPSEVAIQPVSHVNELLDDNNFERARAGLINARKIDQNEMIPGPRRECIGASD
jgi:3-deoxy-D-arabino-heptulosonate 7-phosphate (DAHP) synthase class II